jgi:hypothetical protein
MNSIDADRLRVLHDRYLELVRLEIDEFGVKPTEVRHLIGRLGEFFCALHVEGSLSHVANQHGFDVVSKSGRKVSVKTTAQRSGFVLISKSTMDLADDLMIIQYHDGALSIIYYGDIKAVVAISRIYPNVGKYELDISKAKRLHIASQRVNSNEGDDVSIGDNSDA